MSLPGLAGLDRGSAADLLRRGELDVQGRLEVSSNSALYCLLRRGPVELPAIYKPVRFERPLWDFPDGTLARREVAAALVSAATGWGIVPPTVLRDGPFGPGMVQLWIETDPAVHSWDLVRTSDPRLRPMAIFDALVNNTDRKGGHILPACLEPPDERVRGTAGEGTAIAAVEIGQEPVDHAGRPLHLYGVDHGVCFSDEPKLRTVLWAWRGKRLHADELAVLVAVRSALDQRLGQRLGRLLDPIEVRATRERLDALLATGRFPQPDPERPAIPWPPY
ncbi:MAG: SCO1664 family protein [Candidatus Limnocylindrales bacterium]